MGGRLLDPVVAKEMLSSWGFSVNRSYPVESAEKAISYARQIGFPVVLKMASMKIAHKTDVGGVVLNIRDEGELLKRFHELEDVRPFVDQEARITVEKMLPPGVELFAGVVDDESYGKVLLFGVGGIFVELYGDVTYRLVPIGRRDAAEMLDELRGRKILDGIRGLPSVNRGKVVDFLCSLSSFAGEADFSELDINPLICRGSEVVVADVRIVLKG